ncbi:hypothetical protein [Methylobacillus sp. Pita1]|uniref:hypothetical protein n=1 Tax=Methylobacillus sp. Pita1 TaxID=3382642 RepID=UPI0038B50050
MFREDGNIPPIWAKGTGQDAVRIAWQECAPVVHPVIIRGIIRGLEVQKDFLHEWDYFSDDFDIRDWIVHEPLEAARKLVEAQPQFANFPDNIAA